MMLYIKEISLYDYFFNCKLELPPLGIYYVRHSQLNEGVLLGVFVDEKMIGIAVIALAPRPLVNYIFVAERFRSQGIGTKIITTALAYAKSRSLPDLAACFVLNNQYAETVEHILEKTGFTLSDTATIIRYANDERCSREWACFLEKRGRRICKTLEERGYKTLSYSEITEGILDKLRASIGKDFPANLDPFNYITNKIDCLVPDYSFVTLRNDEPVVFVTVTTADEKGLVFQQISTAFEHQGSGVFILPFAAFIARFLTGDIYSKVSAVIFDNNDRMQRLVKSFIGPLAESIKTQNVYHAIIG